MNIFYKSYCRIFQTVFKIAIPVLPYRQPKFFYSTSKITALCAKKKIDTVLVITDKGILAAGLLDRMLEHFEHHNITPVIFSETVANPTSQNVEDARALYLKNDCGAIIGFGGGSSIDCAKAVGARIANPKMPLSKMKGILKIYKKLPPLIAIPTTAGTGSETTLASVIVDSETRYKYTINSFPLIPRYAILDPKTTISLPPHLTATTGMDALTHAVEAFIGNSTTKETRACALKAVKLIFENIYAAYNDGKNLEARQNMLEASFNAGLAFTKSYVGYVHAVAHSLGGAYNIPHGLANASLLPHVLRSYGKKIFKKLKILAIAAGVAQSDDSTEIASTKFIESIEKMKIDFNIKEKFAEIKKEDISHLAKLAAKEGNPLYPVPVLMDAKQLEQFYYLLAE